MSFSAIYNEVLKNRLDFSDVFRRTSSLMYAMINRNVLEILRYLNVKSRSTELRDSQDSQSWTFRGGH